MGGGDPKYGILSMSSRLQCLLTQKIFFYESRKDKIFSLFPSMTSYRVFDMAASKSIPLLLIAILVISTQAFVNVINTPASFSIAKTSLLLQSKVSSLQQSKVSSSQLSMSDKPEIEVVTNPDKEFLDKKG